MCIKYLYRLLNTSAEKAGLENHLHELQRLNATRVFLALDRMFISEDKQKDDFEKLARNCEFFKSHGFETGAWIWTFMLCEKNNDIHMSDINGSISPTEICPSDENFRRFACDYIKKIAKCGVDIIQFDDDFRYGYQDGCLFGCACENHIKYTEELLGEKYNATLEYFDFLDNQYAVNNTIYDIQTNENAKILSHFVSYDNSANENKRGIGSYYYKNADGRQFLVFAFSAYEQINKSSNYYRNHMRQAQIKYAADLFGGEKLPAYSYGNPDLYILAKKNNSAMSVGLWNIFPDEIFSPVVELDKAYSSITFVNCDGRLDGNRVYLSEIPPYDFAAFEVG